jgi:anti-anti-sigma factor
MSSLEFSSLTLNLENRQINNDNVLIIAFNGQITNTNAYEINGKISELFQDKIYNLILDLTHLQYINSIGVATLLSMIRTVEQNNGKMLIGGLNHFLENVIKLMDLPKQIKIYATQELAISNWS